MMRSPIARAAGPLRTTVRHMSGKDLRFGNEARALMLAGVDKLADAVQVLAGTRVHSLPAFARQRCAPHLRPRPSRSRSAPRGATS